MSADDIALLDRWRSGDAEAGQALFRRHFESIYRFFDTKCHAEADELVQATFLACVNAREQFRGEASFRTYLFAIARQKLYRKLNERVRDQARLDFEVSSIVDLVSTPGTKIARNEQHRQLIEAMQRLPVETQTLLELYYWEELAMDDLAAIFEVSSVVIRKRLFRARRKLGEMMAGIATPAALATFESMDVWARSLAK